MAQRILLIEDDAALAGMLAEYLGSAGFEVEWRDGAEAGLDAARAGFDAVVLDVMLPDGDGFDVLRRLRTRDGVAVLMLTARGDDTDRIVGLEMGADDYVAKPFNPRELLARLRAVLRRPGPRADTASAPVLRFGRLEIDGERRVASLDGEPCTLTGHQFDILVALAESAGRVLSREAILDRVRGDSLEAYDRSIDVHVSRIRAAIEDDPKRPRRILTVRGAGYRFVREQD